MRLLQLISVTDKFQRCIDCGNWCRPAIRAHSNLSHAEAFHCFRCFHVLNGVSIVEPAIAGEIGTMEVKANA